jgi:uncharacterized membrane protein YcjF (UPF0283 family)
MSKADRIKEEIGWFKLIFGALIAVDVSLIAWVVQNYKTAETILIVFCVVAIFGVTIGIIRVHLYAFRRFAKLEKL